MSEPTIAELKEQIRNYELQLEQERMKQAKQREKIGAMSGEVVDSNPYRFRESRTHLKLELDIIFNDLYL